MSNIPTLYQDGIDTNSTFTGVILKIAGVGALWGNIPAIAFNEGEIYNVIKSWSGVAESADVMKNTHMRVTPKLTLSNVVYRTTSDGVNKRPSDDLTDAVGKDARIYYVNNTAATSLDDCFMKFSGSLAGISDYNEKTVSISLIYKGTVGDKKLTTNQVGDIASNPPINSKYIPLSKVYGDFTFGVTGLVKGPRIDIDTPEFVFSDHALKELNMLYISVGLDLPPSKNQHCVITRYSEDHPYSSMLFNAAPDSPSEPYVEDEFFLSTVLEDDLKNYLGGIFIHPTAGNISDYNKYSTADIEALYNRTWGMLGWEIRDIAAFKRKFENGMPESQFYIKFTNFWGVSVHQGIINRRGFKFHYRIDRSKKVAMSTTGYMHNTTGTYDTRMLTYSDILALLDTDAGEKVDRNYFISFQAEVGGNNLFYVPADKILARIGEAVLILRSYVDPELDEDKPSQGLLVGHADCQGYAYGSWINTFASTWGAVTSVPTPGRLIDTGAGIMLSLFIDGESGLTADDFDIPSFGKNSFNDIRMRIAIKDSADTIATVATRLGNQMPWTYAFTSEGLATLITTRRVLHTETADATITYDDLKDGITIGLTDEKYVVNHLTVKSRWFEEQGRYMDEQVFENKASQEKYNSIRKRTVEWPNIDSGQHIGAYSGVPPWGIVGTGTTSGSAGQPFVSTPYPGDIPTFPDRDDWPPPEDEGDSDPNNTWDGDPRVNNAVRYMANFLIKYFNSENGDKGLWSHQHVLLKKLNLPGTKFNHLGIGKTIEIDNVSMAARGINVFGEAFTNKQFVITKIKTTENSTIIEEAIEKRDIRLGF